MIIIIKQDIKDIIYIDDIYYNKYNYNITVIIDNSMIFIKGNIEEVSKQIYNLCTCEYMFKDGNKCIYQTKDIYIDTICNHGKYIRQALEYEYGLNIKSLKNNTLKYESELNNGTYKNIDNNIYSFEQKMIKNKENNKVIDDWFDKNVNRLIIKNNLNKL